MHRGRGAGRGVQRKGVTNCRSDSEGTPWGSAPAAELYTLSCQYAILQRGRWFGASPCQTHLNGTPIFLIFLAAERSGAAI